MRELIFINIGQAGVQISNSMWELFCLEHGIDINGDIISGTEQSSDSIFQEVSNNKYIPRTLTIDLEPTVIDEIRTGTYRQLFSPSQLISGIEDSSCNFARGHFTVGKIYITEFIAELRKLIENCESFQGFMITNSFGGGCGSGFTSLALNEIKIESPKSSINQLSVVPSQHIASAIVEPYNFILAAKPCNSTIDMSFYLDNQSLWKVIQNKLQVTTPTFTTINRLLAQIFSSITVSVRYENALNNDMSQIAINIIPFPRLHYILNFYSPICNVSKGIHLLATTSTITKDVFDIKNKLLDSEFLGEKFLSCCLQYRGNISPLQVNQALTEIKKLNYINFVDWCPTGFKIGINKIPPLIPKSSEMFNTDCSVLLMCNNTCFHQKLGQQIVAFDHLFRKRSFVHWFVGEGMEESEFSEAKDECVFLREDYKCLNIDDEDLKNNDRGKSIQETEEKNSENTFLHGNEVDINEYNSLIESIEHILEEKANLSTEVDNDTTHKDVVIEEYENYSNDNYDNVPNEERGSDKIKSDNRIKGGENDNKDDDEDEDEDEETTQTTTSTTKRKDVLSESTSLLKIAMDNSQSLPLHKLSQNPTSLNVSQQFNQIDKYFNDKSDSTRTEISPL